MLNDAAHLRRKYLQSMPPTCHLQAAAGDCAPAAPSYDLLGVGVSILNIPDAVRRILASVQSGRKAYICVTGMHGIMEARDDWRMQKILNDAFLCTPDGMPAVWIGKAKGHTNIERVYGPDLMLALMEATRKMAVRHFFYGGADGVADDLSQKMEARFPGVQIAGTYCPPFRPLNESEKEDLREKITASNADILWVGLSTPKQERFMAEFLPRIPVKVMLGVGAAFDFHTGRAKQAPRWMQHAGLEWFFRLITEPRRLWKRYLLQVPRFALLVGMDRLGLVSHSSDIPEMPKLFGLTRFSPSVLMGSVLVFAILCLTSLITAKDIPSIFGLCGLSIVPLLSFAVGNVILLASLEEERLDRCGPIGALLVFLETGALALVVPFATTWLLLTRGMKEAFPIAWMGGCISSGSMLAFFVFFAAVALLGKLLGAK